jgi:uncharacterized protein (TIGR03084 family)
MPAELTTLLADLRAESSALESRLQSLSEPEWAEPTPADGWTVRDQVTHLAFFDEAAVLSATDADRFLAAAQGDSAVATDGPGRIAARYGNPTGAAALAWWQETRRAYLDLFAGLDPGTRLPWYGPPMGIASSVTARLMETWAHGQDIFDTFGWTREPTVRLRHIAHLGVRTLAWSFRVHGRTEPSVPVRVELEGPGGEPWVWGPTDTGDRVQGPAEDFCLVVTQRRHRTDTSLTASGDVADAWLDIAQAFAGPPGRGRRPELQAGAN